MNFIITGEEIKKELAIAWKEIKIANRGLKQKPEKKAWCLRVERNLITLSLFYVNGDGIPGVFNIAL